MNKKRIFVIEDDMYVHELLDCLLSSNENYEVLSINDGAKALEILEKEIPDLLFVDYMLPKIDGIEICKKLKKDERTKNLPIILMSASAKVKEVQKDELGIDTIISKPFNMSEVLNQVERLLNISK